MSALLLNTKLHVPPTPPQVVARPQLIERLQAAGTRRLILISAPAGFGKSTLLSSWIAATGQRAAWLSLDAADSALPTFLTYLIAALRTLEPSLAEGVFSALQTPQIPPVETLLTPLLSELAGVTRPLTLVLDDYHAIDSEEIDQVVAHLIEHKPEWLTLVLATREDPRLSLGRLRARNLLVELRAVDLRFTADEANRLLNEAMGLHLSVDQVDALEARTEGWAAGLQLAAISLQGARDIPGFIRSFTGSHRFVMDYLVEEVLQQQPEPVQAFLLRTAILDRLCGPLCDAVLETPAGTGQKMLAALERANLFIVPLDDERRWYRYHHLFAELLRQRRSLGGGPAGARDQARASRWLAEQGLAAEAFQHAVAAQDVDLAAQLVIGTDMPLHFKGVVAPVLAWLASLPTAELDARPALWVMWASAELFIGRLDGIETRLWAAERHLKEDDPDPAVRDLIGHIASIRATHAVSQHNSDVILAQSQRALTYLSRNNLPVMTATCWAMGYAYQLRGDLTAAHQAFAESLSVAEAIGHGMIALLSTLGLAVCEEAWGEATQAESTYARVIQLGGDPPQPVVCEAHLGLARIHLGRNDLNAAEHSAQNALRLARLLGPTDRAIACEVVLARIQLARGDAAGAQSALARLQHLAQQRNFVRVQPEIAAAQTQVAASQTGQALLDPLTPRELEVLQLTAQGLSNSEIGARLFLALSTVKGYQQRIFEKLHVQRRTEAILRARELGLVA